jgi:hypothetical protein
VLDGERVALPEGAVEEQRAPSLVHDEAFRSWWARFLRMSASPAAAVALTEMNRDIDARHVLPAIRVPVLVLHAAGDRVIDVGCGRYMAAQISHARYVELPSDDHLPWLSDADAIVREMEAFVAASAPPVDADRLLVTVVVTELVPPGPTDDTPGAREGDERHRDLARTEVARFRGRLVSVAGRRSWRRSTGRPAPCGAPEPSWRARGARACRYGRVSTPASARSAPTA